MFDKNSKILVAVSGGKDSMSLLDVLKNLGYNVTALYINLGIKGYSNNAKKVVEDAPAAEAVKAESAEKTVESAGDDAPAAEATA